MAYIPLPNSHWYRTNSLPINSDKSFNKEIFKEGLRLETSQAENVLSMLATEAIQSGFLPHQSLVQQAKKKSISEAIDQVYEKWRDFYGWGAIPQQLVKDYLLHGIVHKWTQKKADTADSSETRTLGVPSPISNSRLNKSSAGLVHTAPSSQATPSKLIDRSIAQDEHTRNVLEVSSGFSPAEVLLASPITLRKRTRRPEEVELSDAEVETPKAKKVRTQVAKFDLSKDELSIQQKLEALQDVLREDEIHKRAELDTIVEERTHVETMLKELAEEEVKLAEVKNKVDKTRERAAAMHAATVASRAESKK